MAIDLNQFIARMSSNTGVFERLVEGVTEQQARWKPSPEKWSILEVVNHLYDEEREDFRQRLRIMLDDPTEPLPKINPQQWPIERAYNERELGESLQKFLDERRDSLAWLKSLTNPNWDNQHERLSRPFTAGDLMASWLAHDFLHIRQISRLHWQYVGSTSAPYETGYGGPWKES